MPARSILTETTHVQATDVNLSMGLDRVPHVHDNFCEISTLTEDDFKELRGPNLDGLFGEIVHEQVLFVIQYVRLARTGTNLPRLF